ncbi:4Fe-4S binding protein [Eubacteriaceae bacterium ES2]|nr:4Fe-4S binding protein [Eubacteriaceae bacterium ES2]
MKFKKLFTPTIVILSVFLCVLAYFAYAFEFFNFSTDASGYTISENSEKDGLYFTYSENTIILNTADIDATIYALTLDGVSEMTQANMSALNDNYLGSFIATIPEQTSDLNQDGINENLYCFAKTDMEFTQGYRPTAPEFDNELFPLEVIFSDRTTISLNFNGEVLANQTVIVYSERSGQTEYTTNEAGEITDLPILDIRSGILVTFFENNTTVYQMHYQVEDNTLFTSRYLSALSPFFLILILSVLGIILCLILRRRILLKDPIMGRFLADGRKVGSSGWVHGQNKIGFMHLRWLIMISSFLLLIFGGKLLGTWYQNVEIPIFSCPINQDQLIGSSCYTLSHLNTLFDMTWQEILIFIGSFLASLIILGRVICGFLCPIGLIQDIFDWIRRRFKIEGVFFDEKIYNRIIPLKWVMLLIFLVLCFVGGNFCDICPAITVSPAFAGFKLSLYLSGFLMVVVLIAGFFKRRFFCTICPLGYLMGLFHKISLFKLKKDCQSCTECGACYEACPMGIKSIYTERTKKDVTTNDCIMCGACIDKCPENNALHMTFCGIPFYRASRKTFMSGYQKKERKLKRQIQKRNKHDE